MEAATDGVKIPYRSCSVGRAAGAELPQTYSDEVLAAVQSLPDAYKPSMLIDLECGRRLEVECLSGAVHRLGEKLHVPTPTHTLAYQLLTAAGP